MQVVEPSSTFRNMTRGGQTFMHALRMFIQVMKYAVTVVLFLFISLFISFSGIKTTERNRYLFYEYVEAKCKLLLNEQAYNIIKNPKGTHPPVVEIPSRRFIKERLTLYHVNQCLQGFLWAFKWSSGLSATALILFLGYLTLKGKEAKESKTVMGNSRVTPKALRQLLRAKGKDSDLTLAGVPLVKDTEVQHILLAGTTGTGKSVCMQELMDQVRDQKQKGIVFDIDGALIAGYYRPTQDIILNPLDERCPPWNIWQECRDKADYETLAHSLMPAHLAGHDPFWINSAHTIFTELAEALSLREDRHNTLLLNAFFTKYTERLSDLVAGTPSEPLLSERNEKTAASIQSTLATNCKSLCYLRDDRKGPLFSIRRWIEAEENDSWLFIATDAQKIDALRPLLSLWLDVAAKSVLSLAPFSKRRLWFFVDELPKLNRLPSLKSLLERGRKYGACFVGSIQDVHQIHSVYGRNDAETLTSLFNTKIFFRSQEPQSMAWMSKVMGGLELIEKKEGFSYGANDMRDGVSLHSERRREPVVKESEFGELEDLEAFLKLPGCWPVTQIKLSLKKRAYDEPYFMPRSLTKKAEKLLTKMASFPDKSPKKTPALENQNEPVKEPEQWETL